MNTFVKIFNILQALRGGYLKFIKKKTFFLFTNLRKKNFFVKILKNMVVFFTRVTNNKTNDNMSFTSYILSVNHTMQCHAMPCFKRQFYIRFSKVPSMWHDASVYRNLYNFGNTDRCVCVCVWERDNLFIYLLSVCWYSYFYFSSLGLKNCQRQHKTSN